MRCAAVAGVLVAGLVLAGASGEPPPWPRLPKGAKATVIAAKGLVPMLSDEPAYREFLAATGRANRDAVLRAMFLKTLWATDSGEEFEVTFPFPDPGEDGAAPMDLRRPTDPRAIPPVSILNALTGKTMLIPSVYFRSPNADPYPVEAKLPTLYISLAAPIEGKNGETIVFLRSEQMEPHLIEDLDGLAVYIKHAAAQDKVGLQEMERKGKITPLGASSRALILQRRVLGDDRRGEGLLEVRIQNGPLKDRSGWVLEAFAAYPRLEFQASRATIGKATRKEGVDPDARARTMLRLAEATEKNGKTKGAIDLYRQIVKDFPLTPSAAKAKERLEVLGGRK